MTFIVYRHVYALHSNQAMERQVTIKKPFFHYLLCVFLKLTVDPIIKRIRLSSYMIYLYKFHSIKAKETQDAILKPFYQICSSYMYVTLTLTFDMLTHKSMGVHFLRDCPFSIVRGVRYFCFFFYFFISFI